MESKRAYSIENKPKRMIIYVNVNNEYFIGTLKYLRTSNIPPKDFAGRKGKNGKRSTKEDETPEILYQHHCHFIKTKGEKKKKKK